MNTSADLQRLSKFLSLVLRHEPSAAGVVLDAEGWVGVDDLIRGCTAARRLLDRATLDRIVQEDAKGRYALSADGQRIRANQGHSVNVDLGLVAAPPPEVLFHGTTPAALPSIRRDGLTRQARHHVHLSADPATAQVVGGRRGQAVVLRVRAGAMHADGHPFFRSLNGVWLTDAVPPAYLVEAEAEIDRT